MELNWNLFKTKFNDKESKAFERLSYQLFCIQYNISKGIFRFKNQTGIETEPIQTEEELIGFQAKYYDTKLADNKDDIIDSIKKAKGKNPKLSKILLYTNQEFSESSVKEKKDPEYKTKIEDEAEKIDLTIEWMVPSHFERQLVLPENQYLYEYFFGQGKSMVDFLDNLKNHTENLLFSIQTDIIFRDQSIKFDRKAIINSLHKTIAQPKTIILSGEGGSGKTAIIKEFHESKRNSLPIYMFKAVEFNVQNVNSVFSNFGDYDLNDFMEIHQYEQNKIVVIDSAERISDFNDQEPFKTFLSELLKNEWIIIFTTRLSYLDDLRFQFLSIYRLPFEELRINLLDEDNLNQIASKYNFELPENIRMKKMIGNPFYLNEYLSIYESYGKSVLYTQFKEVIWSRNIQNSSFKNGNVHIARESCFLKIVNLRSDLGTFFVNPSGCQDTILPLLLRDDIIGYDKNQDGYFITHDIYEEWGLDLLLERTYNKALDFKSFLDEIGSSLLIRRAFREWLSDKLLDNISAIKPFIEETFENDDIPSFWKDEILTSVLLSDYSEEFFTVFKEKILYDNFSLLERITFILRTACKEADSSISKLGGVENLNHVFTKPKGSGWNSTIHLIFENQNLFKVDFWTYVLPIFGDWCNNNAIGKSTKETGLIMLKLYNEILTIHEYRYSSNLKEQVIKLLIKASHEIKIELSNIFEDVLTKGSTDHDEPHYELCEEVLSSDFNNLSIITALPNYILKLARLFWLGSDNRYESRGQIEVEEHYGISSGMNSDYFPVSALQTPILKLLIIYPKKTIEFIIDFTNITVKKYVDSGFDPSVREIELIIEGNIHNQYISDSLWNMYRGGGGLVSPYLLQSIHMALEKDLLQKAKEENSEIVQELLIDLIENSISSSITSVVTSVVLAYPNKFFKVAKILFSCDALFHYDNARAQIGEHRAKGIYSIGKGLDYRTKRYEDERLKTCEDQHRKYSLEFLIQKYQLFSDSETSVEEVEHRQKDIWTIIDKLYDNLPEKERETNDDRTKRFLLARIDRRKMTPKVEWQGDNIIMSLNPHIDDDLKDHQEKSLKQNNDATKYMALFVWSHSKFDNKPIEGDYQQYENDPYCVLKETKEIVDLLNSGSNKEFYLCTIPAYACSILVREHSSKLSENDILFCAEIIGAHASLPLMPNYYYQISDGVEVSVNAIPFLIEFFPEEKDDLIITLILLLFDQTPLGQYKRVCDYAIESVVNNLWRISPSDAVKVFGGFLKFKPIFDYVLNEIKDEAIKTLGWPRYAQPDVIKKLLENYGDEIIQYLTNPILSEGHSLVNYSLSDFEIIFRLLPDDINDRELLFLIGKFLEVLAPKMLEDDRSHNNNGITDYRLKHRVFKKYSYFILFRDVKDVKTFIKPFVENFLINEQMDSFFQEIISAEDLVCQYEQFWLVWNGFYEKVKDNSSNKDYRLSRVIHSYLLAWPYWKDTATSWRSLKERETVFYKKAVKDLGHHPSVLNAIAKVLNEIASEFLNDGIFWISEMVEKNHNNKLEENTVYYMEKLVRKYNLLNRHKVRTDAKIKNKILVILNFLISKGSVNAYLLREDIL